MDESTGDCFFKWKFDCGNKSESITPCGPERIKSIIKCSHIYGDGKHTAVEESLSIESHRDCVSTYTSKLQTKRHLKRQNKVSSLPNHSPKKTRLSTNAVFDYQKQCVYCGEDCNVDKDGKNPARWRPAYVCTLLTIKKTILSVCDERKDEAALRVRSRTETVISDFPAAEVRYHVNCRSNFMSPKSVRLASTSDTSSMIDNALDILKEEIQNDQTHIWNSIDLHKMYTENGGVILSRKTLVKELSTYFGEDFLVLSSVGVASIILFRSKASKTLRLVNEAEDDLDASIAKVCKQVIKDVKAIPQDKTHYSTHISCEKAMESISDTVLELLANLSPKLNGTLPALLVGSIITSVLSNYPTSLQVALGVLIRDSKKLVKHMHEYGVTCSYDEVLRFKKSAAIAATKNISLHGISDASKGLVQVVADNFDADISSQNGKLSTHSLAVLMTQANQDDASKNMEEKITRIKKDDMSHPIEYEVPIERYTGVKQPPMPEKAALKSVLSLKILAHMAIQSRRAEETDFAFFQDVLTQEECPEFSGYNTAISRNQNHSLNSKTTPVYLPLIDMAPSDPDTMMTALSQAQQLTSDTGQTFTVFTCDLQLYRVSLHVMWTYPDHFKNVILRLGGMHALMSFVGSIGTLMAESGLSEVLGDVFGGVSKMLTGKKFPQNVRAIRFVAEELIRGIFERNPLASHEDLMKHLEELACRSKTAKLWIDVVIKPVFIIMQFVRAEREGDWPLHLKAFRRMIPYFFAAAHVHYARYGLYYLRCMESLPAEVLEHFMKGEHVMRHVKGLWNGIWSDMFIESTFMRYGHGQSGIIGITLKPETLKTWALGLHICGSLETNLDDMVSGENVSIQSHHKEENKGRMASDRQDREGIHKKLEMCIDPLDPEKHPDGIVDIVSGRVGPASVNVHNSVEIGSAQMNEFESSWPVGFNGTIQKKVVTMAVTKKHVRVGDQKVFDTNLIYSRVIGLQASNRDIDISNVLSHELAPVPTSMFSETGEMRTSKAKSTLKRQLQVEVSARKTGDIDVTVIDGSAMLWTVHWPTSGKVRDFYDKFKKKIEELLKIGDVYLIFDRYLEYSTKSATRKTRGAEASRVFQLKSWTPLPAMKVVLPVTENKKQIIDILIKEFIEDDAFHQKHLQVHKLILTGEETTPVEISKGGIVIKRQDMNTTHEEADNIIVQQVLMAVTENCHGVNVISDDTDVFILLLHHYLANDLELLVTMESPSKSKDRMVVDIGKTVRQHKDIIPELLPAHALSGCDTVACCFNIGKCTILKTLKSGYSLSLLGMKDANMPHVMKQATACMTACYGQPNCKTMSDARLKVWASRTGKGYTSTPKLCSLPPTSEAFEENVKRAHFQACVRRSVMEADPPTLDPESYGWKRDEATKSLLPTTLPNNVPLAPAEILSLLKCGCPSENPCTNSRCRCTGARLPCTVFCGCYSSGGCSNPHTT